MSQTNYKNLISIIEQFNNGKKKEALINLDQILKLDNQNKDLLLVKVKFLLNMERATEAINELLKILSISPKNIEVLDLLYSNLIKIKTKLTRAERDQAIAVYSQRIFINSLFEGNLVEVDHIMPLSKGGRHHPKNLQILSIDENNQKWNRFRPKDQLLWLENHFGDLPDTKSRKEKFKTLKLNVKNV